MVEKQKSTRGLASVSPEKRREVAAMGGRAVPPESRTFAKNPALAREAGRKGGKSVAPEKRSFTQDRALASKAGKKGAREPRQPKETE